MTESDMIIKLIVLVAILSLIYTTIKAVATGVKEGVQNTKDILRGTSYEQIRQKNRQKQEDAFKKNLEKMDFGTMFVQPTAETKSEPLPEAVQEEAYNAFVKEDEKANGLVNGISVGEEAGEAVVITKKTSRKKKSADDTTETA